MGNDELLEKAKKAIDDFFSDSSVSAQVTLDGLEDLQSDISIKVEALQHDIARSQDLCD